MKIIIPFFAFIILHVTEIKCQPFVSDFPIVTREFTTNAVLNYQYFNGNKNKKCLVHKMSPWVMTAGAVVTFYGFILYNSAGNEDNPTAVQDGQQGGRICAIGLFICACGLGMGIGGRIHDNSSEKNHRFYMVAPKRNQIGLAYNF